MKKFQSLMPHGRTRLGLVLCCLLMAFWVVGCNNQAGQEGTAAATTAPSATEAASTGTSASAEATPAAESEAAPTATAPSAGVSPLSSPLAQPTPTPTAIPRFETEAGTGVVTGYLLLETESGVKPVADVVVALASVLKDAEGNEAVVGYDRVGAPRDVTDADGFFVITDIPPDRYGFILDTVMTSYLLAQPDGSGDMLVTVEDQLQIDMGELVYEMLPLSQPVE